MPKEQREQREQKEQNASTSERDAEPVFVAIGGNLGDREANFEAALRALEAHRAISVLELSPVFETDAVGPGPQPAYLNAVMRLRTELSPAALLAELQRIESSLGRDRSPAAVRWGARLLDLDLLFFGERKIDTEDLVVPHPRLHLRAFVMRPMAALAPDWRHPIGNETMASIAASLREEEPGQEAAAVRPWPDPPGWCLAD